MDVFSDGTPCEGDPDEVEVQFSGRAVSQRHVSSNPHAGEVRRVEAASGVWMTKAKIEIETENAKAREQADQKRLIGLAKQTQIGLANIGVKYEMVSRKLETRPHCHQRQSPLPQPPPCSLHPLDIDRQHPSACVQVRRASRREMP